MPAPLLCLFFILICSPVTSASAQTGQDPYLNELLKLSEEKQLYKDRYWEVLLHYKHKESLIDDPKFFLSKDGKTNPQAELGATIEGFFDSDNEDDSGPRCRFQARYSWLKKELGINEERLPPAECKKFNEAMNKIMPKRAVLVFPTAYMNNPASMFGHTLLRIDGGSESKLLSYAVNYSAHTDKTGGFVYAFKGLFGYYKGYFSILPYYEKVKEYSDLDQRDIWEYGLNFNEEEVQRMLMHIWELEDIYSDYYFFDENCSYDLLFLLESARPSLRLTDKFGLWVIPIDTIREIQSAGLVEKIDFRPSMAAKIRHIAGLLDDDHEEAAALAAEGKSSPNDIVLKKEISNEDKIKTLDLAAEYIQSRYMKKKLTKDAYLKLFLNTLDSRGKLGRQDEDLYKIKPPSLPEGGHPSARLKLGIGLRDDRGFQEIELRPVYHDLLDPDEGYMEGSQIEFGNLALRYYPSFKELELQKLDFINIVSISPRSRFFKSVSWKIKTGLSQKTFPDKKDHLIFGLNPGVGLAYKNNVLGIAYIMAESDLNISQELKDKYSAAIGAGGGIIKSLTETWKTNLFLRKLYYELGDRHQAFELTLAQRFKINAKNSITFDISRKKTFDVYHTEAKVSWNVFFY